MCSVGRGQTRTRGDYLGMYHTRHFCEFCTTCLQIPESSVSCKKYIPWYPCTGTKFYTFPNTAVRSVPHACNRRVSRFKLQLWDRQEARRSRGGGGDRLTPMAWRWSFECSLRFGIETRVTRSNEKVGERTANGVDRAQAGSRHTKELHKVDLVQRAPFASVVFFRSDLRRIKVEDQATVHIVGRREQQLIRIPETSVRSVWNSQAYLTLL